MSTPDYLDAVIGNREGYLALAFGRCPYRDEKGKYRHRQWSETRFTWPSERGRMLREIAQVSASGEHVDVYVCPAVRFTDDRRKGSALPPRVCWADLDGPCADEPLLSTLDAVTVASGQSGHRHVYVPLSEPVDLGTHARLNKALAERLGGDHKWSDESLLRLPGTSNHKSDPPADVELQSGGGRVWTPAELAALLGIDLADTTQHQDVSTAIAAKAEPAPDPLPEPVQRALNAPLPHRDGHPDRSAGHHRLVATCRESGLTQGQAVTVATSYRPSMEKYGPLVAEEVARCWEKVAERRSDPENVAAANPRKYFAPHEGLLAATLARDVIGLGPLAHGVDGITWSYAAGVWSPHKDVVRNRCTFLLGDRHRGGHARTAEDVVRARVETITCDPVPERINFANGLLDWRTGTLHPHTPAVPSTVQLAVPHNPDAACPVFERFLGDVLPADMVDTMWELIGYLMYSGNPLHKAVMLVGTGRNGKGTLLRVLLAVLGARNVTTVSLHDLVNTRFRSAQLFGKLANIAGDIDGTYLENTALFKAITGGDTIQAEHKGRDPFDFAPWAVPMFSANKIPASADTTAGYLSRWLVVPFPNSFAGREDRGLDAKLHDPAELAGIAAKGVAALPRLLDRGDFVLGESAQAARDEFVRRVDQVRTWISDCTEPAPDHWSYRTDLYTAYKRWAERDGHKPVKASEFYDRLESAGVVALKSHGARGFAGIRVTDTANVWNAPAPTIVSAPAVTSQNTDRGQMGQIPPNPPRDARVCEQGWAEPAPPAPPAPPARAAAVGDTPAADPTEERDVCCKCGENRTVRTNPANGNPCCATCAPHLWREAAA